MRAQAAASANPPARDVHRRLASERGRWAHLDNRSGRFARPLKPSADSNRRPLVPMEAVFGARVGNCYAAASVLQASCFRGDVTVFRLNASAAGKLALSVHLRGIRRNTYTRSRGSNPEVARSNPAPATSKGPGSGTFRVSEPSRP